MGSPNLSRGALASSAAKPLLLRGGEAGTKAVLGAGQRGGAEAGEGMGSTPRCAAAGLNACCSSTSSLPDKYPR